MKFLVELPLKAGENAPLRFFAVFVLVAQSNEPGAEERHHRHREEVRCKDRNHYAQRHRSEDVFADAGKERHRKEHDRSGEGGGQHCHRNLCSACLSRNRRRFAHLHVAKDVFEHDDAVINQSGKDQRQPAKNHGVDGAAGVIDNQQANHHRERNGKHYGDHGARTAKENKNHHPGQHESDERFFGNILDRQLDEDRLVEDDRRFQRLRNVNQMLDRGFHPVHDGDGVTVAALLEDWHVNRALSVDTYNVVLQCAGIDGLANVAHQHR